MIINFKVYGMPYYAECGGGTMRIFTGRSNQPNPHWDRIDADELYGHHSNWDGARYRLLRGAARQAYKRAHLKRHAVNAVKLALQLQYMTTIKPLGDINV